jgi:hypothetical protein
VFEIAKEEGELKGLRQGIFALLKATSLTNLEIAKMMNVEETLVKTVRQEFITYRQQG